MANEQQERQMRELLERIDSGSARLAVIGLGYVGLPLAVEFGARFSVIGFDVNKRRLDELRAGQGRRWPRVVVGARRSQGH